MSDYDPDVAAAFGVGSAPAAVPQPAPAYDPDVAAAFSDAIQRPPGGALRPAAPWLAQEDKPIDADSTPISNGLGAVNKWAGSKLASGAQALGMTDPNSLRDIRNLPEAVEAIVPGIPGRFSAPEGVATAASHPLAEAAASEQSRVAAIDAKASAAGFDIGNRTPSAPNLIVNKLGRDDLQLPTAAANGIDALLTPNMLHAANKQYVSPAYQAVESYPKPITLSPITQATLNDVRPLLSPKEAADLPSGDTATGQQIVSASKLLRARANQIPDTGMNAANNQMWSSISQAHVDAARSLENDAKTQFTNDGQPQLADNWDAARIYRAKSAAYEHSLDGAGNIRATDLKNQLVKQGVPLTDNAEMIAHVAAKAPELFKGAPAAPQPGIIKRSIAGSMPGAGAALGAHIAGMPGAVAGQVIGEHFGQKLLGP